MTLLRIAGLRVRLRHQVLAGVDLALDRGETLGLVGESGSGKSMTALAVMGLLPEGAQVSGEVLFEGTDLLRRSEAELCRFRGRRAGMVFQEPMTALNPLMRVRDQVAEALTAHGAGRRMAREQARQLLARVGVRPEAFPHLLSGGQRQRAVIAMALACNPDLLIADEPTSALDVLVQAQILDLLAGLAAERRMALLLISHDLGVVSRVAQRVAVMYAGRIVEAGRTATVLARRAHPYTRALFAASPNLAADFPVAPPGRMPEPGRMPPGCAFAPRCPRAQADCRAAVPEPAGEADHLVACRRPFT